MNYKIIDKEKYYRHGVFRHFMEDCKCSTSITAKIDVTELVNYSRLTDTKFYINFLYLLTKVLNSRDDYKMGFLWETGDLICYDTVNPIQYIFHEDTETCTPVYTNYYEDYNTFYVNAMKDVENAKKTREYKLDMMNHPNWFDASYISWLSYDALHVELPDGYPHFAPIINWGKYSMQDGRLMMPLTVRLNHAIADGYLVSLVFKLLEKEIGAFCKNPIIETERLNLYIASKDEMISYIETLNDAEMKKAFGEMLQGYLNHPKQWEWNAMWVIELKDGTHVGDLSFKGLEDNGTVEIGYGIVQEAQKNGYATEAVKATVEWAANRPEVSKVEAEAEEDNKASLRVLEKCGFVSNGVIGEEGPRFEYSI